MAIPFLREDRKSLLRRYRWKSFLADHYKEQGARVWIVPTSINTELWRPPEKPESAEWTVGWTGTSSNLKYLYAIEEPLADFLKQHPGSRLLVVCDTEPSFKRIPPRSWRFERWSPEREVSLVQEMDAGLAPLADTEWARGKCALKMLMYMAVGIPVVCSPVGSTRRCSSRATRDSPQLRRTTGTRLCVSFREPRIGFSFWSYREESCGRALFRPQNALLLAEIFREAACA
jgi:hypothetical protein